MRFQSVSLRAMGVFALLASLLLAACHLSQEAKEENSISFNQLFDQVKGYDSVVISLVDDNGRTIDVAFHGKVSVPGDLEKRPTPHWDGGKIRVVIQGYEDDVVVFNSEAEFDGKTNAKGETIVTLDKGMGLLYTGGDLKMVEGDSINLPAVSVAPATITVRGLKWSSSAPDVLVIGPTGFKAQVPGISQIKVSMQADSSKSLTFKVTVLARASMPESIALSADTLHLSAGGNSGRLEVTLTPSTAAKDVLWSVDDGDIASVDADGLVKGLKSGYARLMVRSALKEAISDTAVIEVTKPVPAERVLFAKETTEIFVGGAAESLLVSVLPPKANQEVEFTVVETNLIGLDHGKINAKAEGNGIVIARSKENPELADTLKVKITMPQIVESVSLGKKAFTLYTGGADTILTASVRPGTTSQKVQWRSTNPAVAKVADGKVTGLTAGHAFICAISLADSTKKDSADVIVKTDVPVVSIGRPDTTVSVGSTVILLPVVEKQEYGQVVKFKWDLDGAAGWDDSANAVASKSLKCDKEQDYPVSFYVRDTEGNETIVTKKISAVNGPVVLIASPVDGQYFTAPAIKIVWTIDGKDQATGTDTVLKDGANLIIRSAKDAAGKVFTYSITVYLDSVPPAKPHVRGVSGSVSPMPTWTWAPGGGGSGYYRVALDSESFSGAEIKDTLFVPTKNLGEGPHTLYVQERDAAGNWSTSGKHTINVDITGPGKPDVKVNASSPSNVKRPKWTWTSGGGGSGNYQYKFDNGNFASGTLATTVAEFTPAFDLGDGNHTLYVRESDSLGTWGEIGSAALTTDTTAPGAPKLQGTSPTSSLPKWTWASGGGGSGDYRFKVGANPANGDPETKLLEHTLSAAVSKTTYILYIQERDAAGNWSPVSNLSIYYDLTKPTVAFTAPATSGTFMTKNATVDVAGTSSSPQGPGSVKSVAYTIDGVTGNLSTNMASDGSWSIKALPLTNNKMIALKVIATDVANNTGEATLNILMDNTAPGAPTFSAQPPSVVRNGDIRTSLVWSWTPSTTDPDTFIVNLNGTDVAHQLSSTYAYPNFSDGEYILKVYEKDAAGNVSTALTSAKVLVDRVVPNTPAPSVSESPTRDNTPTWSWASNGGNGNFEYRIASGSAPTGAGTAINASTYTPNPALGDGTWYFQIREKDAAENLSAWSSSSVVTIKASAPSAPSVSRNATPTNAPKWTWSSNGVGDGTFRYRWSGAGAYLGEGLGTEYAPNLSEGNYNLCVSEKDLIGYGSETCVSITVDKTAPVISAISPADGFITNKTPITIGYKKDGVAESFNCDLVDGEAKTCSKTVYDAAGNPSTVSRTITYRKNALFVRAGAVGGDGSSWDSPFGSLGSVLQPNANKGKEIWVSAGTYSNGTDDFWVASGIRIYGGFSATGYPNSLDQRDPAANATEITNQFFLADKAGSGSATGVTDVVLDGLTFTGNGNVHISVGSYQVTVRNCIFHDMTGFGSGIEIHGTAVKLEGLIMKDNPNLYYAAIQVSFGAGTVDIIGGDFRHNVAEFGSGGMFIQEGTVTARGNAIFYGNVTEGTLNQIKIWGGHLDISGCQIDEGIDGIIVSDPEYLTYGSNTKI